METFHSNSINTDFLRSVIGFTKLNFVSLTENNSTVILCAHYDARELITYNL